MQHVAGQFREYIEARLSQPQYSQACASVFGVAESNVTSQAAAWADRLATAFEGCIAAFESVQDRDQ